MHNKMYNTIDINKKIKFFDNVQVFKDLGLDVGTNL